MENEGDVGINDQVDLDDVEDGEDGESDEMRAALGGVASGLAEQLTTITQEMNKIREELYGDNGIGGIAQELEKLKSGNLGGIGGLLDHPELTGEMDDMDDMDMASAMARPEGGLRSRPKGLSKSAASKVEAPRRPPLDKERKLEELRRKIERRHLLEESKQKNEKTGFLEWLVIIFVFFMMIYTASSSFRSQVKLFFGEIFGEIGETEEVFHDFGAVVEEDVDSYFWDAEVSHPEFVPLCALDFGGKKAMLLLVGGFLIQTVDTYITWPKKNK